MRSFNMVMLTVKTSLKFLLESNLNVLLFSINTLRVIKYNLENPSKFQQTLRLFFGVCILVRVFRAYYYEV